MAMAEKPDILFAITDRHAWFDRFRPGEFARRGKVAISATVPDAALYSGRAGRRQEPPWGR